MKNRVRPKAGLTIHSLIRIVIQSKRIVHLGSWQTDQIRRSQGCKIGLPPIYGDKQT